MYKWACGNLGCAKWGRTRSFRNLQDIHHRSCYVLWKKICRVGYDANTTIFQYELEQENLVSCLDPSPDNKLQAVGLNDGTLKLYNISEQLKQIYSEKIHETSINTIILENMPKELNLNFSYLVSVSGETKETECVDTPCSSYSKEETVRNVSTDNRDFLDLERLKRSIFRMFKTQMDSLENELNEHCIRLQRCLVYSIAAHLVHLTSVADLVKKAEILRSLPIYW